MRRGTMAAQFIPLLTGAVLLASGCALMPNFPELPTAGPTEILNLNLVPELDLGEIQTGAGGSFGFSDIQGMTVRIRNIRCTGLGTGTGFAIDPYTIITNRHVLEGSESLVISTFDGRDLEVSLADVIMSDDADIAIVKVSEPLDAYVASRREHLYQDEPVKVIGFPEGGPMTVTEGIVLGLIYDGGNLGMGSVILTDAEVLPGSSGSPLLDSDGKLVGVIYARTDEFQGLAVPVEMLDGLLSGDAATRPLISCRE